MNNLLKFFTAAIAATVLSTGSLIAREGDQISIVGSSTVFPFSTIVAERFAKNTDFKAPVIESTGTGGGAKLFCAGIGLDHPDVTNASRAMKSSEKETCTANGITPVEYMIGFDGITFSNSNKAQQYSLTKEEIFKAVSAKIMSNGKMVDNGYKRWSDINPSLPSVKIDVLAPPPSSGTRDAFVELVMHDTCKKVYKMSKKDYKASCSALREDGAVTEAGENDNLIIEKLAANQGRFGIFGYSFLDQNKDKVQGSIVNGVAPSMGTIADSSYKVSRPLFFYVKKEHVGVVPGLQEFADYFMSLTVSGSPLESAGLIPKP
ncbi:MAG: substrate-binding domain-containing protein [Paracoccaceae bacterium]|jgi:phosphate transport system substrate-binding protein|tara:strand:+ start:645 stop:1601 length:957 start_codon:yes stop_codon:yes gene_type:complete